MFWKAAILFNLKKNGEIFLWDLCSWVVSACLVCVFTLKRLKETYFRIQLQKYMDFYGGIFYIFPCPYFCFCNIIIVLNTSLLKACITRWLWTPTASEPVCESSSIHLWPWGIQLKLSVTYILSGRLWIITILSHCVVMRLSNLKICKNT